MLLASHSLPIPSSLSSASNLRLCLVSNSYVTLGKSQNLEQQVVLSGQAYLLVSSVPLPTSGPKSRKQNEFTGAGVEFKLTTAVVTIPYTVPKVSTIAAAVGRGHVSGPWLKDVKSSAVWNDPTKPQTVDDVEKNLMLAAVRDAVRDGRPQAAEVAFLNWTSTLKERTDDVCPFVFSFASRVDVVISVRICHRPPRPARGLNITLSKNFLRSYSSRLLIRFDKPHPPSKHTHLKLFDSFSSNALLIVGCLHRVVEFWVL